MTQNNSEIVIVICEDSPIWVANHLRVISPLLNGLMIPSEVLFFDNGQKGLEAILELQTASSVKTIILITDGQMPEMSGYHLLGELSQLGILPKNAAICTASRDEQEVRETIKLRGSDPDNIVFIPKISADKGIPAFIAHALQQTHRPQSAATRPPSPLNTPCNE